MWERVGNTSAEKQIVSSRVPTGLCWLFVLPRSRRVIFVLFFFLPLPLRYLHPLSGSHRAESSDPVDSSRHCPTGSSPRGAIRAVFASAARGFSLNGRQTSHGRTCPSKQLCLGKICELFILPHKEMYIAGRIWSNNNKQNSRSPT